MGLLPRPRSRAAVLGHPIEHSLSPALHRAAYRYLGLAWSYDALDVEEAQLSQFLSGLDGQWAGLSLTMPLKEAVIGLLTDVDPEAALLRSVNTVVIEGSQRRGYNTDVTGLVRVLEGVGVGPGSSVLVLGGGATARSAVGALSHLDVSSATVCARRAEASQGVASLGAKLGLSVHPVAWAALTQGLSAEIVVSTLPVTAAAAVIRALPDRPGHLVDVGYDPWPTPLAAAWRSRGGAATGGLSMLVHQGVEQVRLMTGQPVPPEVLMSAGRAELRARRFAQGEQ